MWEAHPSLTNEVQVGSVQRPWGRAGNPFHLEGLGPQLERLCGTAWGGRQGSESPDLLDSQEHDESVGVSCLPQKSGVTDHELMV